MATIIKGVYIFRSNLTFDTLSSNQSVTINFKSNDTTYSNMSLVLDNGNLTVNYGSTQSANASSSLTDWNNMNFRRIELTSDYTYDEGNSFATWFKSNTQKTSEVWKLNSTLTLPTTEIVQEIDFACSGITAGGNAVSYKKIKINSTQGVVMLDDSGQVTGYNVSTNTWANEYYRELFFKITAGGDLYTWLTNNAIREDESKFILKSGEVYDWKNVPSIPTSTRTIDLSLFSSNKQTFASITMANKIIQYSYRSNTVSAYSSGWKSDGYKEITISRDSTLVQSDYDQLITNGNLARKTLYTITYDLLNVKGASTNKVQAYEGSSVTLNFSTENRYVMPDLIIVNGASTSDIGWNKNDGTLTINNISTNISIKIQTTIVNYLCVWNLNSKKVAETSFTHEVLTGFDYSVEDTVYKIILSATTLASYDYGTPLIEDEVEAPDLSTDNVFTINAVSANIAFNITQNGKTTLATKNTIVRADIDVVVNVASTPTQEKSITIIENGTTEVTPDSGKNLSKVTITTNVPSTGGIEEISTSSEMDAKLASGNVGNYYLYTGTTDSKYTNGDIYKVQEKPLPQLSKPTNVSISGTTLSWDEVENAESYDIYADGALLGNVANITLISFTINNGETTKTCQAEEGMTWSEWINSSYQDTGWTFLENSVKISINWGQSYQVCLALNDEYVVPSDVIINSGVYAHMAGGGNDQ